MQLIDGAPVYSATDLVGFLACQHLTNLERAAVAGLVERPHRADPELDRIAQRGLQHERRFLAELHAQGLRIVEIAADDPEPVGGEKRAKDHGGDPEPVGGEKRAKDHGDEPEPVGGEKRARDHGGDPEPVGGEKRARDQGGDPEPAGGETNANGDGNEPARPDRGADLRRRAAETLAAMKGGADVIYQATFLEPVMAEPRDGVGARDGVDSTAAGDRRSAYWLGFADFLRRVDTPSALGTWSYEAWDTKLARHVKASAVLQLCVYSDLLERVQGVRPAEMHVALGGSARAVERLRTADYAAYYRLVRDRFVAFVGAGGGAGLAAGGGVGPAHGAGDDARPAHGAGDDARPAHDAAGQHATAATYPPPTRPDPVEHCDVCRWQADCAKWRRQHDDLSLVANITTRQRRALREHEPPVDTRRKLAAAPIPLDPPLPKQAGVREEGLRNVHEQARIQVEGEDAGRTIYELLPPARLEDGSLEPDRGLLGLPEPSSGDLFLDLEGDPFAFDDGIDYLFGIIEPGLPAGAADPRGLAADDDLSGLRAAGRP